MTFLGVGATVAALAPTMLMAIVGNTIISLGTGGIIPLCFSVIGDLFPPAQRSRWSGLLNVPGVIAASVGPWLAGYITEISPEGWRYTYWLFVPLAIIAGLLTAFFIPGKKADAVKAKIDWTGIFILVAATALLIFGVPYLGKPGQVGMGVALIIASVVAYGVFYWVETKAEAPVLDPRVLLNRTFITAAMAGFFSLFGFMGILFYGPVFAQNVMGVSPSISGTLITPFTIAMSLMGIPAGFLLGSTKKYKWMYNIGYVLLTASMFLFWTFTKDTPPWLFAVVAGAAGISLGTIPTVNTLVAQFAVPKELLGVAVGAIYFFVLMGMAVGPQFLGLAQAAGADLEAGLKNVYLVGSIMMAASTLLIFTIPGDAMEKASAAAD
jgi:MFS family permease